MDPTLLQRAVDLAEQNAAAGQLPFGALVVRAGEVLATGVNTALRDHDPAAHAGVPHVATEHVPVDGATLPFRRYLER